MLYISLHASQHLITANYQRLPCVIWCVFFLQAIPSNYTYIMSSSELLLDKGSPLGSFSIGQWREMAHIHLDQCCPGLCQSSPSGPEQSSPGLAVDWHMGWALPARPMPKLPTTPNRNHFNLHLHDKLWKGRRGRKTNQTKNKEENKEWEDVGRERRIGTFFWTLCFGLFSLFLVFNSSFHGENGKERIYRNVKMHKNVYEMKEKNRTRKKIIQQILKLNDRTGCLSLFSKIIYMKVFWSDAPMTLSVPFKMVTNHCNKMILTVICRLVF